MLKYKMYFSVSQYCFEFVSYLILLCVISIILSLVIGVWGIMLCLIFMGGIIIILYLFRFNNICPANLIVNPNICIWPSDGILTSISHGTYLRLTGEIITIESKLFDCYTHVSPIYGYLTKITLIPDKQQVFNTVYIQLQNDNFMIDMIISSSDTSLSTIPIILAQQDTEVYASQPLCLVMFRANVKFVISHNNKINLSKLYVGQNVYLTQLI